MLTLPEAAHHLGIPVGTLRRWVREGCPVVLRGHRGRGHACMVDVEAVQRWRESSTPNALLLEIAAALPDVLARAMVEAWKQIDGTDKRRLAGVLAGSWYVAASEVLDYLRAKHPGIPDVGPALPEQIERLRKIARE